jgi:phage tail-like protein
MPDRTIPYPAFNFLVNLNGPVGPEEPLGGFSEVSGITLDLTIAEYRNGNERENHPRKVAGLHKVGDVTLKRGVVNSQDLWTWVDDTRRTGVLAKREVVITLRDENGQPVQAWTLHGAMPMKFTAPTLNAKTSDDVAIEEIVLAAEGIDLEVLV